MKRDIDTGEPLLPTGDEAARAVFAACKLRPSACSGCCHREEPVPAPNADEDESDVYSISREWLWCNLFDAWTDPNGAL